MLASNASSEIGAYIKYLKQQKTKNQVQGAKNMSDSEILIKVENVSKKFCRRLKRSLWYGMKDIGSELIGRSNSHKDLRKDEFWFVKNVTFEEGWGAAVPPLFIIFYFC